MGEKKCCFCCEMKWKIALFIIALCIILYGLISFGIWVFLILRRNPSAIYLYLEFPVHATVIIIELLYAEFLGFLLLFGLILKIPRIILIFAWCLLFAYALAFAFLGAMISEGFYVVDALIYSYIGREYVSEGEKQTEHHITVEIIYYLYMGIHIVLLVLLATYTAILTVSHFHHMKEDVE